ncbi:MAG: cellulase family glycosylhydrolase [Verrucomicrobiales bacterium]
MTAPTLALALSLAAAALISAPPAARAEPLPRIRPSSDGAHFAEAGSGARFTAWGVNYDHDEEGRLLEDYWIGEWETVAADFREIKALGANVVRIHLQFGKFVPERGKSDAASLAQLKKLVALAEETGLYLDVTGLGCYHKADIPAWYDTLPEAERWAQQAAFWSAVAEACGGSPAIFCFDLMNEPILPGENAKEPAAEWLGGELGGKFFVQRLTLDLNGRTRHEAAKAWVAQMAAAIRQHDNDAMLTVGVIPWAFAFYPNAATPIFYAGGVDAPLDFVSVHFYPKKGEVDKALAALKRYELGKPMVIEEMFPLSCSQQELVEFIQGSKPIADGWISFYWGTTAEELGAKNDIGSAIKASWLKKFQELSGEMAE